jgi:hypothetical protein
MKASMRSYNEKEEASSKTLSNSHYRRSRKALPADDKWLLLAYSAVRRFSKQLRKDATILSVDAHHERATYRAKSFLIQTGQPDTVSPRRILGNVDWRVVKNWLRFCKAHHSKHCILKNDSHISSLQVIDCENRQLITVEDPNDEYLTLSYV